MTNASCMFVRMDAWSKYGVSALWNGGWASIPFGKSIARKGLKTCNFDFYIDKYVIHLGRATLKGMKLKNFRIKFGAKVPAYGMSYEKSSYGRKELGENYIGFLELKIPSAEYDSILKNKYGDLPFNQMTPPIDPQIFGEPTT